MKEQLDRIEGKLDKLERRLDTIDVTLAEQHVEIRYHIKRTDLLESKVEPITDHVVFIKILLRVVAAIVLVGSALRLFKIV
jgi:hypothetical protein